MYFRQLLQHLKTVSVEEQYDCSPRTVKISLATMCALIWGICLWDYIFSGADFGADSSSHLAEILKVAHFLRTANFDFWCELANMGYPLFTGYNALPYLLMGLIALPLHDLVNPSYLYNGSVTLLWSLLPLTWYYSARLMTLPRLTSLFIALSALVINDYANFGLTIKSSTDMGLYTQLWGMMFFPLVLAHYYRLLILNKKNALLQVIFWHSLLCSTHNLLAFFAGIGALLLFLLRMSSWRRYCVSQILILLLFSYWIVAYLAESEYLIKILTTNHPVHGEGFKQFLLNLATGRFFDSGYALPALTFLLGAGIFFALRVNNVLRWWALLYFFTAILLYHLAPGDLYLGKVFLFLQEIPSRRYITIIHVSGIILLAGGATYFITKFARFLSFVSRIDLEITRRDVTVACIFLAICVGAHNVSSKFRAVYLSENLRKVAELLSHDRDARFLVHGTFGTGSHIYRNYLSILSGRPQLVSYARGVRDTISFYYTEHFDFSPTAYQLFNVQHVLAKKKLEEKYITNLTLQERVGSFYLYRSAQHFSNFDVVRSNFFVDSFTNAAAIAYLRKETNYFYRHKVLPRIRENPPADMHLVDTSSGSAKFLQMVDGVNFEMPIREFASNMLNQPPVQAKALAEIPHEHGYRARIVLEETAYLLLKASFHPNWQATNNGKEVEVVMLAPSMMGVALPAGAHDVVFAFHSKRLPQILFLFTVCGWFILLILLRKRRSPKS